MYMAVAKILPLSPPNCPLPSLLFTLSHPRSSPELFDHQLTCSVGASTTTCSPKVHDSGAALMPPGWSLWWWKKRSTAPKKLWTGLGCQFVPGFNPDIHLKMQLCFTSFTEMNGVQSICTQMVLLPFRQCRNHPVAFLWEPPGTWRLCFQSPNQNR